MKQFFLPAQLDELKSLKQWVCYRLVWDEERQKNKKIPIDPATGLNAKANDPGTWATYDEAVKAAAARKLSGVGFEFAVGYMGIDLDGVIDSNGQLNSFAQEIVTLLDSYTEFSPSGKGLHVIIKTSLGKIGSRNDNIGLEMYNEGRFFTVTGDIYGSEPKPIQDRTEQAQEIYNRYLKKPEKKPQGGASAIGSGSAYSSESNSELWCKMFASKEGEKIRSLYNGDTSRYNSHSSADMALINFLAQATNNDPIRMDEMFRQTGLMRPKWDRKTGASTYGARTIEEGIRGNTNVRVAAEHRSNSMNTDNNGNIENTSNTENAEQEKTQAPAETEQQPQKEEPSIFSESKQPDNVKDYIYSTFKDDLSHFQSFKDRKTGFYNLDEITSLYPGLYVIGAISSLGKTTFTHQLGDQLATMGDHVLYFSLEQTRLEMVSKSLSRKTAHYSYDKCFKDAVSAIDIRRGKITEAVREAAKEYAVDAHDLSIIECGFDTTIDSITSYVTGYIKANDVKPIVIVDYLQIIRPSDPRQTTKDAVDGHVRALKKLQTDNDLVVFVISSLNRQNYLTPVDFESFKESGGIEYTADVIWGLQLSIMNTDIFDKKDKIKEKREQVKAAKLQVPRKIELVCLKNRYGRSSYTCEFHYFPKYDLFRPAEDFYPIEDPDNPF